MTFLQSFVAVMPLLISGDVGPAHAEILLRAGRADEAMEILQRVEEDMAETGEYWCQSEWLRVHALAHHAQGKQEHGRKLIDIAAGVAERQGAENWLGRVRSTRDKVAG